MHRSTLWTLGTFGPAAFHVTLSMAATHIAQLRGLNSSLQSTMLKTKALERVRVLLSDPSTSLSDETLAAILQLAAHEVCELKILWSY
jgi:hypothetical protein